VPQPGRKRRQRGSIVKRGNSYRVLVYAGTDPVTGKRVYLDESTTDEAEAERIRTRLLAQVDKQNQARTKGTLGYAIEEWLRVQELEQSTRETYEMYVRRYVNATVNGKPGLGEEPMSKVSARVLEKLYAELRRCRARCDGRPGVDHRVEGDHECRVVRHRYPPGRPPVGGYPDHDCAAAGCRVTECKPHMCRPLANASILKLHFIIAGTLSAAVRWDWIDRNPAEVAKKPEQPKPQPKPPTVDQAARIVDGAWKEDPAWGTLVWLVNVTGLRRGELVGLRWRDVDLADAALYCWDTKTGTMRRVSLDPVTVELLTEHHNRYEKTCRDLDVSTTPDAYVFSYSPTHDRPCNGSGITHRYARLCKRLGIDSHLHAMRHYSATQLLTAGVDVRTVGGRLGHAPGTTLRVYSAWTDQADKRAAEILGSRMTRPK
jgi:site-specific recombinase XerD